MALHEVHRVQVFYQEDAERTELAELFEGLPYVVTYAREIGALANWGEDECSVVLLSCNLPDEPIHEFLARRESAGRNPHTYMPVLVTAPEGAHHAVTSLLQLGADDFLLTPTTPAMLQARLENVLALCHLRRHAHELHQDESTLKLEHDLQVARRIQAGFLPRTLPEVKGWEIGARFQPARQVAGDFYDAFMLSHNRRVGFVIADVVDKGIPAALFMALVRSLTRAFAQQHYSINWSELLDGETPARGARRRSVPTTGAISLYNAVLLTNNYIIDNHIDDNMFATLFFGMLDPSNGQLAYINAGHNPPFIFDAQGNLKAALKNTGAAVGMFPNVDYTIENAQMEPGDLLFAYTDGVTEARNPAGEFVTEARLLDLLAEPVGNTSHVAIEVLDRVDLYLQSFMQGAEQFDDITMMAIHYKDA